MGQILLPACTSQGAGLMSSVVRTGARRLFQVFVLQAEGRSVYYEETVLSGLSSTE